MTISKLIKEATLLDRLIRENSKNKHRERNTHFPTPKLPKGKLNIVDQWASLVWNVDTAEAHGLRALNGLTLALVRIIQADMLEKLLFDVRLGSSEHYSIADLLWDIKLPIRSDGATLKSILRKRRNISYINLAHSAVLPQPWKQWRLARSLQKLGSKGEWGEWKQSSNIHAVAWTPWPIVWVDNGNHSTMAAILTHGGQLKASETFDAKELLLSVYTDGLHWLRVDNGQAIAPVESLAMAAIFEIGRRLIKAPKK